MVYKHISKDLKEHTLWLLEHNYINQLTRECVCRRQGSTFHEFNFAQMQEMSRDHIWLQDHPDPLTWNFE
jgi:hypothetical protein